jgi:acyl carrier protein
VTKTATLAGTPGAGVSAFVVQNVALCRSARLPIETILRSAAWHSMCLWDSGSLEGEAMRDSIRDTLRQHARLSVDIDALTDETDLYQAGMTSHATVNVMLALEQAFDIEFPDQMLRRSVFESVAAMRAALEQLRAA